MFCRFKYRSYDQSFHTWSCFYRLCFMQYAVIFVKFRSTRAMFFLFNYRSYYPKFSYQDLSHAVRCKIRQLFGRHGTCSVNLSIVKSGICYLKSFILVGLLKVSTFFLLAKNGVFACFYSNSHLQRIMVCKKNLKKRKKKLSIALNNT